MDNAVILADFFHDNRFYALIQVNLFLCSPFVRAMLQERVFTSPTTLHLWLAWEQLSRT